MYVPSGYNKEQYFFDSETVCYDFHEFDRFYFDGTDGDQYPAHIMIQAFVTDDEKTKYTNVANLSIKYYYGKENYYSVSP